MNNQPIFAPKLKGVCKQSVINGATISGPLFESVLTSIPRRDNLLHFLTIQNPPKVMYENQRKAGDRQLMLEITRASEQNIRYSLLCCSQLPMIFQNIS